MSTITEPIDLLIITSHCQSVRMDTPGECRSHKINMAAVAAYRSLRIRLILELKKKNLFNDAGSCAATQELPRISWNPKVHYRFQKSPPLVPILRSVQSISPYPIFLRSILILSTHLSLSFPNGIQPISYMHSPSSPFVLHALIISPSLTWSFYLQVAKSTSYEAPHYAVFSSLIGFL
jgi:hypothetical protein